MYNIINLTIVKNNYKSLILDFLALSFIYFAPALSHLTALPIYFLEPMRIMVIIAIAHTSKKNAYLLALSLPIFSFLISAHPSIIKTSLITSELLLNVMLFYILSDKLKNIFTSTMLSILISKIFYYAVKFIFISLLLMNTEMFSTPLYIQGVTILLFSLYLFWRLPHKNT